MLTSDRLTASIFAAKTSFCKHRQVKYAGWWREGHVAIKSLAAATAISCLLALEHCSLCGIWHMWLSVIFYSFSKLPLFIWQVIGLVENPSDQYLGNLTTNGRPWPALVVICIRHLCHQSRCGVLKMQEWKMHHWKMLLWYQMLRKRIIFFVIRLLH